MKKLIAILLAAMFLALPVALAEEAIDIDQGQTDVASEEPVTDVATEPIEVTSEQPTENLSDAESQAITETIEGTTETTEEVPVTPDMPLRWGLKTWTEKLDLLLTFNKAKKAEKKLAHARERLQEMKQMAIKKNLKALAKAQRAHANLVAELAEGEEALANEDLTAAEKVESELQKHIQVLESVKAKLEAKGVPTHGVENALVKSRNALDKFQSMNETRKAKISEKLVNKAEKLRERIKEKAKEGSEEESEEAESETEVENETEESEGVNQTS